MHLHRALGHCASGRKVEDEPYPQWPARGQASRQQQSDALLPGPALQMWSRLCLCAAQLTNIRLLGIGKQASTRNRYRTSQQSHATQPALTICTSRASCMYSKTLKRSWEHKAAPPSHSHTAYLLICTVARGLRLGWRVESTTLAKEGEAAESIGVHSVGQGVVVGKRVLQGCVAGQRCIAIWTLQHHYHTFSWQERR